MELGNSEEEALRKAVDGIVGLLGVARPSEEAIKEALTAARAYALKVRKPDEKKPKGAAQPRYFWSPA